MTNVACSHVRGEQRSTELIAGARRNDGDAKTTQLAIILMPGMQVIFGGLESRPCAALKIDKPQRKVQPVKARSLRFGVWEKYPYQGRSVACSVVYL